MTFRYNALTRICKQVFRMFFPVPRSPWTMGEVEDICEVHLVPPKKLVSFFESCIKRLRKLRSEGVGSYLEFGVFNGSSLGSLIHAARNCGEELSCYGFDAFEGLPPSAEDEDDGVWKKGFYACSYEDMSSCLRRRAINPKEITFVQGWYEKTLTPATAKKYSLKNIGMVFIDCDTYSSSKAALEFIAPLIVEPIIICFDDWKLNDLDLKGMGEYQSFNEFLEAHPEFEAKPIRSYNRKSKTFILSRR